MLTVPHFLWKCFFFGSAFKLEGITRGKALSHTPNNCCDTHWHRHSYLATKLLLPGLIGNYQDYAEFELKSSLYCVICACCRVLNGHFKLTPPTANRWGQHQWAVPTGTRYLISMYFDIYLQRCTIMSHYFSSPTFTPAATQDEKNSSKPI